MRHKWIHWVALTGAAVLAAVVLVACGSSNNNSSTSSGSSSSGKTVALLLPESKTARYESQDKPHFEQRLKALCSDCKVIYENADQDASKQQSQAEAAITNGAKVLVLDPVDGKAAAAIATRAKQSGVTVIAYDRMVESPDVKYYISFDNRRVGELQATALVDKVRSGPIVMINGSPTDANAAQFKAGAHSVIDSSNLKVAKQYDTPDWSPDQAQNEMQQAITALGKSGFVAVYAANDGTAGGAIAAMKAGGVNPATKPTTGQDAELAGIQRIVAGQQYMTVYKAIKTEAEDAAQLTVDALNDKPSSLVNQHVTNTTKAAIPSVILTPVAVTTKNISGTVVKDGFWTVNQICTSAYAADCKKIGLTTSSSQG
jgi:D-xylose transport system substrate-binding protein